jgi:hypothetical protein
MELCSILILLLLESVHLVGFIVRKFVTFHDHMNVKLNLKPEWGGGWGKVTFRWVLMSRNLVERFGRKFLSGCLVLSESTGNFTFTAFILDLSWVL